jgi:hypothetical protein
MDLFSIRRETMLVRSDTSLATVVDTAKNETEGPSPPSDEALSSSNMETVNTQLENQGSMCID